MEFGIGLTLLWLLWLVSTKRWRRRLTVPICTLAIGLIIASPWGLALEQWGLTAFLPVDSGNTVDAIVVLGRGTEFRDLRVAEAQKLWQANRASRVFASGMSDARSIVQELQALGIPKQNLDGEECSQSTKENAQFTQAILHPLGVRTILLVTDAPHLLRSVLTFRSVGFHVISHPSSLPVHLLPQEELWLLVREYLSLVQYALTGQFNLHSSNLSKDVPKEVIQKISDWKCRVQIG